MIKSKRQNNIKLMTLMIAMTAVARQAKQANVTADGLRRIPRCLLETGRGCRKCRKNIFS